MHLLSDQMKGKYVALKRTTEHRKEWYWIDQRSIEHNYASL